MELNLSSSWSWLPDIYSQLDEYLNTLSFSEPEKVEQKLLDLWNAYAQAKPLKAYVKRIERMHVHSDIVVKIESLFRMLNQEAEYNGIDYSTSSSIFILQHAVDFASQIQAAQTIKMAKPHSSEALWEELEKILEKQPSIKFFWIEGLSDHPVAKEIIERLLETKPQVEVDRLLTEQAIHCTDKSLVLNGFERHLLMQSFPYFQVLWQGPYKEGQLDGPISLDCMRFSLKTILRSLYEPIILEAKEQANLWELYSAADKWNLKSLKEQIEKHLDEVIAHLDPTQVDHRESAKSILSFLESRPEHISQQPVWKGWQGILQAYLNQIAAIPPVSDTEELWQAFEAAIKDSPQARYFYLTELSDHFVAKEIVEKLLTLKPQIPLRDLLTEQAIGCTDGKELVLNGFEKQLLICSFPSLASIWINSGDNHQLKDVYNLGCSSLFVKLALRAASYTVSQNLNDPLIILSKVDLWSAAPLAESVKKDLDHLFSILMSRDVWFPQEWEWTIDLLTFIDHKQKIADKSPYLAERQKKLEGRLSDHLNSFSKLPNFVESKLKRLQGVPIHSLSLTSCLLSPSHLGLLKEMPALEALTLGDKFKVKDKDLKCLTEMRTLKKLEFKEAEITGETLYHLMDLRLEKLSFYRCRSLTQISIGWRAIKTLKRLDLRACWRLENFAFLKGLQLEELHLNFCDVNNGALSLLKGMPLKRLELEDCRELTTEGLFFLKELPLERLNLNTCLKLRGRDLLFLVQMPLKNLLLKDCHIEDEDIIRFAKLAHTHGMPLTWIDLTKTQVTGNGIAFLKSKFPNLSVSA